MTVVSTQEFNTHQEKYFDMQKFITYLVAAIIASATLTSCNRDDRQHSDDNGCICILRNVYGELMGYCSTTTERPEDPIFAMYPNPADGFVALNFETDGSHLVTITNKRGKELLRRTFSSRNIAINISDYPADTYRVTVDDGKQKSTLCLIKD
ncbi:MAG: T9SS type A sorting domain-containing protein [Bacteroidales bacterium]|nr:T9SS type A sorting domain-containing protein [Bacteroidales bacterium]